MSFGVLGTAVLGGEERLSSVTSNTQITFGYPIGSAGSKANYLYLPDKDGVSPANGEYEIVAHKVFHNRKEAAVQRVEKLEPGAGDGWVQKGSGYYWAPRRMSAGQKLSTNVSQRKPEHNPGVIKLSTLRGIPAHDKPAQLNVSFRTLKNDSPVRIRATIDLQTIRADGKTKRYSIKAGVPSDKIFSDSRSEAWQPKQEIVLNWNSLKPKGFSYLLKRELGLPADEGWVFVRDHENVVMQRRLNLKLANISHVVVPVGPGYDKKILINFRVKSQDGQEMMIDGNSLDPKTLRTKDGQYIQYSFDRFFGMTKFTSATSAVTEIIAFVRNDTEAVLRDQPLHMFRFGKLASEALFVNLETRQSDIPNSYFVDLKSAWSSLPEEAEIKDIRFSINPQASNEQIGIADIKANLVFQNEIEVPSVLYHMQQEMLKAFDMPLVKHRNPVHDPEGAWPWIQVIEQIAIKDHLYSQKYGVPVDDISIWDVRENRSTTGKQIELQKVTLKNPAIYRLEVSDLPEQTSRLCVDYDLEHDMTAKLAAYDENKSLTQMSETPCVDVPSSGVVDLIVGANSEKSRAGQININGVTVSISPFKNMQKKPHKLELAQGKLSVSSVREPLKALETSHGVLFNGKEFEVALEIPVSDHGRRIAVKLDARMHTAGADIEWSLLNSKRQFPWQKLDLGQEVIINQKANERLQVLYRVVFPDVPGKWTLTGATVAGLVAIDPLSAFGQKFISRLDSQIVSRLTQQADTKSNAGQHPIDIPGAFTGRLVVDYDHMDHDGGVIHIVYEQDGERKNHRVVLRGRQGSIAVPLRKSFSEEGGAKRILFWEFVDKQGESHKTRDWNAVKVRLRGQTEMLFGRYLDSVPMIATSNDPQLIRRTVDWKKALSNDLSGKGTVIGQVSIGRSGTQINKDALRQDRLLDGKGLVINEHPEFWKLEKVLLRSETPIDYQKLLQVKSQSPITDTLSPSPARSSDHLKVIVGALMILLLGALWAVKSRLKYYAPEKIQKAMSKLSALHSEYRLTTGMVWGGVAMLFVYARLGAAIGPYEDYLITIGYFCAALSWMQISRVVLNLVERFYPSLPKWRASHRAGETYFALVLFVAFLALLVSMPMIPQKLIGPFSTLAWFLILIAVIQELTGFLTAKSDAGLPSNETSA